MLFAAHHCALRLPQDHLHAQHSSEHLLYDYGWTSSSARWTAVACSYCTTLSQAVELRWLVHTTLPCPKPMNCGGLFILHYPVPSRWTAVACSYYTTLSQADELRWLVHTTLPCPKPMNCGGLFILHYPVPSRWTAVACSYYTTLSQADELRWLVHTTLPCPKPMNCGGLFILHYPVPSRWTAVACSYCTTLSQAVELRWLVHTTLPCPKPLLARNSSDISDPNTTILCEFLYIPFITQIMHYSNLSYCIGYSLFCFHCIPLELSFQNTWCKSYIDT